MLKIATFTSVIQPKKIPSHGSWQVSLVMAAVVLKTLCLLQLQKRKDDILSVLQEVWQESRASYF